MPNGVKVNVKESSHDSKRDFQNLTIDGCVCNVTRVLWNWLISVPHCVLDDCSGYYRTRRLVLLDGKHLWHLLCYHYWRLFMTRPTGAKPIKNFVIHLVFTHGFFLNAWVILDHKIMFPVPQETGANLPASKETIMCYHTCNRKILVCLGWNILCHLLRLSMVNHERVRLLHTSPSFICQ